MRAVASGTLRSVGRSPIAIDASALVELLLQTPTGQAVARLVAGAQLIAPDVVNPETVQALRGLERGGSLDGERADKAISALAACPVKIVPMRGLIADAWSLRANLSAYDAFYVALARALDCPLLTTDVSMQRAPALGLTFLTVS